MRKPSDLTKAEIAYCQDCLPRSWEYDHEANNLVCHASRTGEVLEMKYIKYLTDYLISINVTPYAE